MTSTDRAAHFDGRPLPQRIDSEIDDGGYGPYSRETSKPKVILTIRQGPVAEPLWLVQLVNSCPNDIGQRGEDDEPMGNRGENLDQ